MAGWHLLKTFNSLTELGMLKNRFNQTVLFTRINYKGCDKRGKRHVAPNTVANNCIGTFCVLSFKTIFQAL